MATPTIIGRENQIKLNDKLVKYSPQPLMGGAFGCRDNTWSGLCPCISLRNLLCDWFIKLKRRRGRGRDRERDKHTDRERERERQRERYRKRHKREREREREERKRHVTERERDN